MMTLLSTLISFLAGGLPKILTMLQDRQDKSHELAVLQLQTQFQLEMAAKGYEAQRDAEEIKAEAIEVQANAEERVALYQHDMKIGEGASQWVINLRASVRPIVTYMFMVLLMIVDISAIWYAYDQGAPFAEAARSVFTDDQMLILSSVIAFWFGGQAFQKK